MANDVLTEQGKKEHKARKEAAAQAEPAKPREDKAVKFRRLANKRVPSALKRIQHVRNLANTNQYAYSKDEASKLVTLFRQAVDSLEAAFTDRGVSASVGEIF